MDASITTALKVIITGATGMVGEGILHECLKHPNVTAVLIINRRSCGITHPKLKEVIHADFFDLHAIEEHLKGYNACFFCLGISSIGMQEKEYHRLTYTLTLHMAKLLSEFDPTLTFCYVSDVGTDSSEKGNSMWARVKGKTENDLLKLPFKQVFAFRPGFIKPTKGLKNAHSFYRYVNWLFPIGRVLYPNGFCTLEELGKAMINAARHGYTHRIIEGKDIISLSKN